MKHIYYDKLVAENVRCHRRIEMDFPAGKFYVVAGKNGQGKSTVYKSISMALYGDDGASEGERATIDEMINNREGKNLSIEFKFHIVNEDETTDNFVINLRNKHKTEKNGLFLTRNGVDISGKTKTDTYKLLSRILYPRDVYHTIVYFNQQVKDFFTALTSSKQMKIFNAIMELGEYDVYGKNAKGVVEQLNGEMIGLKNKITSLISSVDGKTELIQSLEARLATETEERQKAIAELNIQASNVIKVVDDLTANRTALTYDEDALNKLNSEIAVLNSRIVQLTADSETIKDKTNGELETALAKLKSDSESEYFKKKDEIESKYKEQLSFSNAQLREVTAEISKISTKFDTSMLHKELSQFRSEKDAEKTFVHREISSLDSKFSTVELESTRDSQLKRIDKVIETIKGDVDELKQKGTSLLNEIAVLEKSISRDEESLEAESPLCTKCGQKLNESHKDKIRKQIVVDKATNESKLKEVALVREDLEKLKVLYDSSKSDYQASSDDYAKQIEKKRLEKDQKKQILESKIERIDKEIRTKAAIITQKITDQDALKMRETSGLEEKKTKLENEQDVIVESERSEVLNLKQATTKDFTCRKLEYNKRYGILLEERQENIKQAIMGVRSEIRTKEVLVSGINAIKEQLDEIDKQIASNNSSIEFINKRIEELTNETSQSTMTEIDNAKQAKFNIETEASLTNTEVQGKDRELDILTFWREGFSDRGIKNMLIDSSIPFINREWNKELNKIVPGVFTVSFDTMGETKTGKIRDKLSVNILHNIKGTNQFKLLSGGEKRLMDLSIMRVLKKLAAQLYQKQFHVGLYDEILDSLDDDNSSAFCQLLKIMSRDEHVSLITHKMFEHIDSDQVFRL